MSLNKNELYLSALSGGADSTALLLHLIEGGYHVEAVHCNFHLRGAESDRDEAFCQQLCKAHGVALHIAHFDTIAYAQMHHQSIETAARNLRYNYFFQLVGDLQAAGICVAHNRNDQAETLLMKLVRGAGIHGLSGMKPVTHITWQGKDRVVYRPLLDVSRKDIEAFLRKRHQPWVTDSTNLEDDATRNKFRHNILPVLEAINPSAIENIARAAINLQAVEKVYNHAVDEGKRRVAKAISPNGNADSIESANGGIDINISLLLQEPSPESVLFELLSPMGFNGSQVADINAHLDGVSGREWRSPSHTLLIDRGRIVVVKNVQSDNGFEMRIPEEGTYVYGGSHKLRLKSVDWDSSSTIPRTPDSIALDYSKVKFPLTIRTVRQGDRFIPFGMKGSKLVSDFLTDRKLSVIEKRRQTVLCDASGTIVWLVGLRPDNRFRISPSTTRALLLSIS